MLMKIGILNDHKKFNILNVNIRPRLLSTMTISCIKMEQVHLYFTFQFVKKRTLVNKIMLMNKN